MQLSQVENYTPFEYFAFEKMAPGTALYDVLIVKAACELQPGSGENGIVLTREAAPIRLADEHYGESERTSLRRSGDTVLYKPATDVYVSGTARAPAGLGQQWMAQIELQSAQRTCSQRLRLWGERHWQWGTLKGWHLSAPEENGALPLRYELAFGGRYAHKGGWQTHAANPVGCGFLDPAKLDRDLHYPAPRIESFDQTTRSIGTPIACPTLGPIPRFWAARKRHAGTYDTTWEQRLRDGDPDYPADFDYRFFQASHADWVFDPYLTGGEALSLLGLTGDESIVGQVPTLTLEATLLSAGGQQRAPLRMDTVEIDLDASRLYLTWRLAVPQTLGARVAIVEYKGTDL